MSKSARSHRFALMLNDHELRALSDYRFAERLGTQAAAMRKLMLLGLILAEHRADESRSAFLRELEAELAQEQFE